MGDVGEFFEDTGDFFTEDLGGSGFKGLLSDVGDFFTKDIIKDPLANVVLPLAGAAAVIGTGGAGFPLEAYLLAGGLGASAGIAAGQIVTGKGVIGNFISGSPEQREAEALIEQGMSEGDAVQQAALNAAMNTLNPFTAAGIEGTKGLQEFGQIARPLSSQALAQLGTEALAPPGLSPGEEFQLREQERGISRLQASRGQLFSGRAGEELLELGAGKIASQSERDRKGQLSALAAIAPNIFGGLTRVGAGTGAQTAGFQFGTGQDVAQRQFAGGTQLAGLEESRRGLFGENTQDILSVLGVGTDIAGLFA
jgi:hypothetical protein